MEHESWSSTFTVSSLKDSKESPRAWNGGKAKRYRITLIIPFSQRREERLTETEWGTRIDHFNSICKREQRWRTLPCWQPSVLLMSSAVWRMIQAWSMPWIQPYTSAQSLTNTRVHREGDTWRWDAHLCPSSAIHDWWIYSMKHQYAWCRVYSHQRHCLVIMCH